MKLTFRPNMRVSVSSANSMSNPTSVLPTSDPAKWRMFVLLLYPTSSDRFSAAYGIGAVSVVPFGPGMLAPNRPSIVYGCTEGGSD